MQHASYGERAMATVLAAIRRTWKPGQEFTRGDILRLGLFGSLAPNSRLQYVGEALRQLATNGELEKRPNWRMRLPLGRSFS